MIHRHQDILDFWFDPDTVSKHYLKDEAFDQHICTTFGETHRSATLGELYDWREVARGRLAEIIVLDQFSRNIFRNDPRSFAYDGMALILSQELIRMGGDQELGPEEKAFAYMPLMHSESLKVHDVAMKLFDQPGLENNFAFEKKHRDILLQFGRYPHRNEILGRESTAEEWAFLETPGSSF